MILDFEKDYILENERVRLEPLSTLHFIPLSQISNDNPGLLKYSPAPFGKPDLVQKYILDNILLREKKLKYPFAIYCKEKNLFAGSTSFLNISPKNQRLEIGSTWVGRSFQRTGLNRNCKFLLMRFVFEELECKRLEFKTDARNLQSQRAIEGIGGIKEGTLRSHMVMSDGYRRDTVYYSVLRSEWPEIKSTIFSHL